jgi:hypothetical protein
VKKIKKILGQYFGMPYLCIEQLKITEMKKLVNRIAKLIKEMRMQRNGMRIVPAGVKVEAVEIEYIEIV